MTIKLFYVGSKGTNFGDSINPLLFERVLDTKVQRAYPTFCDVVGVGSLMQALTFSYICRNKKFLYFYKYNQKPAITMGTGFMFNNEISFLDKFYRPINPYIIRGKLSHQKLEKMNKKQYQVAAYGDLGLLFPYLLEKTLSKKYSLGIIPHKSDFKNPHIQKLSEQNQRSILLDLRNDPIEVLKQIAQCETVISSSLHGLIVADALNIPNKRIKLSNHGFSKNIDFKFDDYYSIFDCDTPECIDLLASYKDESFYDLLTPDVIANDYKMDFTKVQQLQNNLLIKAKNLPEIINASR